MNEWRRKVASIKSWLKLIAEGLSHNIRISLIVIITIYIDDNKSWIYNRKA